MRLPLRLPQDAERVPFGPLAQTAGLVLRLPQQLFARQPGIASQLLGVFSGRTSVRLRFGESFRAPAGGISGSSVAHPFGGVAGGFEHPGDLLTHRGELVLQIALGELPQTSGQTVALGDEVGNLGGDHRQEFLDFGGVGASEASAKVAAGDLIRRQLVHLCRKDTPGRRFLRSRERRGLPGPRPSWPPE